METVEELAKKAVVLNPNERVRLIEAILYSLDKLDPQIKKAWVAESEARYEAYQRGELKAEAWMTLKRSTSLERTAYYSGYPGVG